MLLRPAAPEGVLLGPSLPWGSWCPQCHLSPLPRDVAQASVQTQCCRPCLLGWTLHTKRLPEPWAAATVDVRTEGPGGAAS